MQIFSDRVRVGQYDSRENITCGSLDCELVLEIAVEERFGHREINMGLMRLGQDVPFTSNIMTEK